MVQAVSEFILEKEVATTKYTKHTKSRAVASTGLISGEAFHESRRDSATKHRVARNELSWVQRATTIQLQPR